MSIGSGLGAFLAFVKESAYGTYVAPSKFPNWPGDESLKATQKVVQGGGLAAGRLEDPGSQRVIVATGAEGGFPITVSKAGVGIGQLLQQILGTTVVPAQQAATTAYLQTIPYASNAGKSMTVQVNRPTASGTDQAFSYVGGKITEAEFSCKVGEMLTLKTSWDFKAESTAQAAVTPSYAAAAEPDFDWSEFTIKTGTLGAETALGGVRGITLKISRPVDTERYNANNAGTKDEPIENAKQPVTGTIEAEFRSLADLHAKFSAGTSTALLLEWTGGIIASTYAYKLGFSAPMIFIDEASYNVAGPDMIVAQIPFAARMPATGALITGTYMSTDATA